MRITKTICQIKGVIISHSLRALCAIGYDAGEVMMNLKKFTILNANETQNTVDKVTLLINTDHIVSIKPINITDPDKRLVEGYWIRLSNSKKYKAISIPPGIQELFNEALPGPRYVSDSSVEIQMH
jgi:hypothetical protein